MSRLLIATALFLSGTVFVHADPVEERQELMKERGSILQVLGPIAQGRQDFDADRVLAALEQLNENAQRGTELDVLWPEGSEGGDSAPAIWSDREAYQEQSNSFAQNVAAAVDAAPQDIDTFRAAFGPVASSCGSCHEVYRER